MAIEIINPAGLAEPEGYSHVAVATGRRIVFLAGQIANDEHGELVGPGDLAAQTAQALLNVGIGLEAAGASFEDVAKLVVYVVDWESGMMEELVNGLSRVAEQLGIRSFLPATLVGVQALIAPEFLIGIDATAVIEQPAARRRG